VNYNKIVTEIYNEVSQLPDNVAVASYIPELGHVDPNKFGVNLRTLEGDDFGIGDFEEKFSIQSIAKVLSLTLVYNKLGPEIWERVGVEPSGNPFNSLLQLEADKGKPRNPLINAGAIVVCDILISNFDKPKEELLAFIQDLSGIKNLDYSHKIANSEKLMGFRNAALINLMKDLGNIKNDIYQVLDLYFHLCSIEMTCRELSKTFLYLANDGIDPGSNNKIINLSRSKRLNAIMQLCGFYDEAGEFSFKVGLPGKSGIGGGIVAIYPEHYSIAVWSPRLNSKGNSYRGMKFLELFTSKTGLSIF
jgi:glutaminase